MSILGLGGHLVRPDAVDVLATPAADEALTVEWQGAPFANGTIPRTAGSLDLVVQPEPAAGGDRSVRRTAPPTHTPHAPTQGRPESSAQRESASQRALKLQLAQLEGRRAASGVQPAIPDRTTHPELAGSADGVGTPRRQSPDRGQPSVTARPASSGLHAAGATSAQNRPSTTERAAFKPTLPMPFALSESNKKPLAAFGPHPDQTSTDTDPTAYDAVASAKVMAAPDALQSDGTTLLSHVGPLPPSMRPRESRQPTAGPNPALPRPSRLGSAPQIAKATPRGRRGMHELAKYGEATHHVEIPPALRNAGKSASPRSRTARR